MSIQDIFDGVIVGENDGADDFLLVGDLLGVFDGISLGSDDGTLL